MKTLFEIWPARLVWIFGLATWLGLAPCRAAADWPWQTLQSDEPMIIESSGLGFGGAGLLWTHNDSGDGPNLFALDTTGHRVSRLQIINAAAIDWEDIAMYSSNGQRWILAADCGDNQAKRASIQIYRIKEPILDPAASRQREPPPIATAAELIEVRGDTIEIRFDDGPHDCEAIAVDPLSRQIVLIAKTKFPWCGIYVVPLADLEARLDGPTRSEPGTPLKISCVATRAGHLPLPMVTAMDIHPGTGEILVCGYWQAFVFRGSAEQSLPQRFAVEPIAIDLPKFRQIEGACFDLAGNLWISSEGTPMELAKLPADALVDRESSPPPAD